MDPLEYFEVECPEKTGGEYYRRIADVVLLDHNLIRVIHKLHIYIDPKVPIFIAVGQVKKLPGVVRLRDFADINVQGKKSRSPSGTRPTLPRSCVSSGKTSGRTVWTSPTVLQSSWSSNPMRVPGSKTLKLWTRHSRCTKTLFMPSSHPAGGVQGTEAVLRGGQVLPGCKRRYPPENLDDILKEKFKKIGVAL